MDPKKAKIHREIMEDAVRDEDDHPPSFLFKLVLGALTMVVIITFLITFIGGGQGVQFLQGRLASTTISDEFILVLEDGREVHLVETVYDNLVTLIRTDGNEFKACLIGEKKGTTYQISDLYVPEIVEAQYDRVVSAPCNENTLISLHSHPIDHCVFSEQDFRSFETLRTTNPGALMGLMCGLDRFSFYGKPLL